MREATRRYLKSCFRMCLTLHRTKEADLIEKLESVPNKSGYIKELIRRDIENERPA